MNDDNQFWDIYSSYEDYDSIIDLLTNDGEEWPHYKIPKNDILSSTDIDDNIPTEAENDKVIVVEKDPNQKIIVTLETNSTTNSAYYTLTTVTTSPTTTTLSYTLMASDSTHIILTVILSIACFSTLLASFWTIKKLWAHYHRRPLSLSLDEKNTQEFMVLLIDECLETQ
ncbi:MAG: hypothetical protein EXX96DRAFT_539535 [Benjaminiella poitrasii]|nr:MAG: hypothetical protein EXX96DRAFT_539535 [Benjaminiella poitrasii]